MKKSLFALFFTIAACAQNAGVMRQAAENPLANGATLALQPLSFQGLMLEIMSEETYLGRYAGRPELRAYPKDKEVMAANFETTLREKAGHLLGAGPQKLHARAVVIFPGGDMDTRSSEGVRNNTRGTFSVKILSADNALLDEIKVEVGVAANSNRQFASDRMREMGTQLGTQVADYLLKRAGQPAQAPAAQPQQ